MIKGEGFCSSPFCYVKKMLFLAFVFQCVLFWLLKSQVICFVMLINEKSAELIAAQFV